MVVQSVDFFSLFIKKREEQTIKIGIRISSWGEKNMQKGAKPKKKFKPQHQKRPGSEKKMQPQ